MYASSFVACDAYNSQHSDMSYCIQLKPPQCHFFFTSICLAYNAMYETMVFVTRFVGHQTLVTKVWLVKEPIDLGYCMKMPYA